MDSTAISRVDIGFYVMDSIMAPTEDLVYDPCPLSLSKLLPVAVFGVSIEVQGVGLRGIYRSAGCPWALG